MNVIQCSAPFYLESGEIIHNLRIAYHTFGTLNAQKSNVVWVCHALTANSDVLNWWPGLFGSGQLFDPEKYFIVCVNVIGSAYGSTGPTTPGAFQRPLLDRFPFITIRDMVAAHDVVRKAIGIDRIHTIIGASLGGQQVLEWNALNPGLFDHTIVIATNARHSAYGIAFNESQRLAILADPSYGDGSVSGGRAGLIAARSIAMLSYRSYAGYAETQTNPGSHTTDNFLAASYQEYQGRKLADRFNAYAYTTLSKAMDSHHLGRNRGELQEVLSTFRARTLVIGIDSDGLFPLVEQEFLARHIPKAFYAVIQSDYGHDGFLIETDQLSELIHNFLNQELQLRIPTTLKLNYN